MLTRDEIKAYQAIFKKIYKEDISYEKALEQGTKLLHLVELIYKPMTEDEYKLLLKRREDTNDKNKN